MSIHPDTPLPDAPERMQCMEVWGGNHATRQNLETPGLRIWLYSQPIASSESGGDVHYISSCASGRITRMLLADVSGHGQTVSKLALGLRDLMRKNVNVIQQTRLVRAMNRQFAELSQLGVFATAVVVSFFQPTRRLAICNAGHTLPLLYQASTGMWSVIDGPTSQRQSVEGIPLGIDDLANYLDVQTIFDKGDMLLCYSDALSESVRADGVQLGTQGLLSLVSSLDASVPNRLLDSLQRAIKALNPNNLCDDDVTMLLIEANGTGTPIRETLLAPFRLLGSVKDKTRFTEET